MPKNLTVIQRQALRAAATEEVQFYMNAAPESLKINRAKRQVTTQVMTAFKRNLNGFRMLPEDISDALDSFMAGYQVIGRMHVEVTNSYPIRAWQDSQGNGWLTRQVVDDVDWDRILSGEYGGTSWGGKGLMVQVDQALAQELGIEPDFYLIMPTYVEDSFVDVPAVQEATFNNAPRTVDTEQDWLIDQVLSGRVAPRVRAPEPSLLQRALDGAADVLRRLPFIGSNNAADSGESNSPEELDMDRTELKELLNEVLDERDSKLLASVDEKLGELKNSLAADSEGAPPEEAPADQVMQVVVDDKTLQAAVESALLPLREQLEQTEKQLSEANNRIAELEKMPAQTQRLDTGGDDGNRQPRRKARHER
jgi:hypothetical protein